MTDRFTPASLTALVSTILQNVGSSPEEAGIVARNLVDSDATGHTSHGVCQVPIYVKSIGLGHLQPNRHARVVKDAPPFLVVDGEMGYGQVVAREATELAIARAKTGGATILALRHAHHVGRVGSYGEQIIGAGLAAVFFVNVVSRPQQSPYGGARPRLGTNPICIALPATPGHPPVLLDFATSALAANKCRVAKARGEPVAEGTLIDPAGNPTRDPGVMFSDPTGAILPFGGYKASGLALACELLGGVIAAGLPSLPRNLAPGKIVNNALAFVFDPARIADSGWEGLADEVQDYIQSTPAAAGFDRVRLPGEPEREHRAQAAQGIALDTETVAALHAIAAAQGFTLDSLLTECP